MQLLRSAMLLCATFCFFGGLRYLPLAEGSAITFLAPIIVVVLSGPILQMIWATSYGFVLFDQLPDR